MTVHFICRGNVLRSLIAETYLKSLAVPGLTVISSGTIAGPERESNQAYLENTHALLRRHHLTDHAKLEPEQLTPERLNEHQLVICVNQRAFDEAQSIAKLPQSTRVWDIVDIGESTRIADSDETRTGYEEEIFDEITSKVDELVKQL